MTKKLVLFMLVAVFSIPGIAAEKVFHFVYQGKVQGMVCAFCVYNVSKKIAQMPEISSESVNVDLETKLVSFRSSSKVSLKKLENVFSNSGFKLVELKEVNKTTMEIPDYQSKPVLAFSLANTNIKKYQSIFESIGTIAASTMGKLVIKAPESIEIELLKPMIGGKQNIARIQYEIETDEKNIEIKLYLKSN